MRTGALAATAVLGVLVIGGLPALALTLAADEAADDRSASSHEPGSGPPPWAHGDKSHKGSDDKHADKRDDEHGPPPWAHGPDDRTEDPPGWAHRDD